MFFQPFSPYSQAQITCCLSIWSEYYMHMYLLCFDSLIIFSSFSFSWLYFLKHISSSCSSRSYLLFLRTSLSILFSLNLFSLDSISSFAVGTVLPNFQRKGEVLYSPQLSNLESGQSFFYVSECVDHYYNSG